MKDLIVTTSEILILDRILAHARVSYDLSKGYIEIRFDMPDGSWRSFYVSNKVLEGKIEKVIHEDEKARQDWDSELQKQLDEMKRERA